ncbi:hypothetical protein OEZ85_004377 [Tetradesmus obliquus]|uniref:Uncharacterized protein n=1 Tax=Tetradesmus obliquus TaxID=3088 RepID=A0ABY8UKI4_TETOB|nr:hypothetical protein OEZ85_004377 [Tetradesmus obliquus]
MSSSSRDAADVPEGVSPAAWSALLQTAKEFDMRGVFDPAVNKLRSSMMQQVKVFKEQQQQLAVKAGQGAGLAAALASKRSGNKPLQQPYQQCLEQVQEQEGEGLQQSKPQRRLAVHQKRSKSLAACVAELTAAARPSTPTDHAAESGGHNLSLPPLLDLSHEPAKVLQARLARVWAVLAVPAEQQMAMVLG